MKINQKQKYVMIGGLLLIVVMALFPPWYATLKTSSGMLQMPDLSGYSFIGKPPPRDGNTITFKVNVTRLSLQLLVVLVLTEIGVLAFSGETQHKYDADDDYDKSMQILED